MLVSFLAGKENSFIGGSFLSSLWDDTYDRIPSEIKITEGTEMTNQMNAYRNESRAAVLARRRARARRARIEALTETAATVGIGLSLVMGSVAFLCVV